MGWIGESSKRARGLEYLNHLVLDFEVSKASFSAPSPSCNAEALLSSVKLKVAVLEQKRIRQC
jgi:hypothetical protein